MTDTMFTLYRDGQHGTADMGVGMERLKKTGFWFVPLSCRRVILAKYIFKH